MDFDDLYNASPEPEDGDFGPEPHDEDDGISENMSHPYAPSRRFDEAAEPEDVAQYDSYAFDELYFATYTDSDNEDAGHQMIALEDAHAILSWAANMLSASPTALAMMSEAEELGWTLALESLDGPEFHIDVPHKTIVLDNHNLLESALGRSEYFRNATLVNLICALRDIWQEKRHGAFDVEYGPENVLTLERLRAADMDVISTLVAWELRSENLGSLWRHMIGSEEGDIAMRFSGCMERDPASQFNGRALREAFKQWFRDENRISTCDHDTLNYLDEIMEEHSAEDMIFGNTKLTAGKVEILSCLPDRTAYLQGHGPEIMSDPNYAGLDDIINQAHLMQILHDLKAICVQDVPFRDSALASKIFPNGEFTGEDEGSPSF